MRTIRERIIHQDDVVAVMMSREVIEQMATRTEDGCRIHVEWGEPDEYGYHIPTLSIDYEDRLGGLDE